MTIARVKAEHKTQGKHDGSDEERVANVWACKFEALKERQFGHARARHDDGASTTNGRFSTNDI